MGGRLGVLVLLLAGMLGLAACAGPGQSASDPGLVAGSTHSGGGGYH